MGPCEGICRTMPCSHGAPILDFIRSLNQGLLQKVQGPNLSAHNGLHIALRRSPPMTVFRSASSLRRVKFTTRYTFYPCEFDLPWDQLIELEFACPLISEDDCYAVLRQCTNLTRLKLPFAHSDRQFPVIYLPRLEALMEFEHPLLPVAYRGFPTLHPFFLPSMKLLQIHSKYCDLPSMSVAH